jgi:phage gp36-like protein
MQYLDRAGLLRFVPENKLAQMTDDDNGQVVNEEVVSAELATASTTIDRYLRNRYTLPLLQSCTDLGEWAGCIVRHNLYMRRPEGAEDLPPAVVRTYKETIRFLEQVRDGLMTLDVVDSAPTTTADDGGKDSGKARFRSPKRQFGPDAWDQYQ